MYPIIINAMLLAAFAFTLIAPPSMAFRFALLSDKFAKKPKIRGSLGEQRIAAYCKKVTAVWCLFFIGNGTVSAFVTLTSSDAAWALYNGGISYILIGIVFGIELIVRRMIDKTIPKAIPLSAFTATSRKSDTVICYSGVYGAGRYKTWGDFLAGTSALRTHVEKTGGQRWILHCNDYWYFLLAYTALLQCKKEVLLTANISPAYLAEIAAGNNDAAGQSAAKDNTAFLTDEQDALALLERAFYVPGIVEQGASKNIAPEKVEEAIPAINADETVIVMYTSGTTGQPKAVRQRLTEFETDNAFVLSRWGEEFLKRKLCSTVSPHHIYGLLFSVILPFTAGVPFRRERIEYPETFHQLHDDSYLIITVPALLKRAVETQAAIPARQDKADDSEESGGKREQSGSGKTSGYGLHSPWIFTSGGAVPPDIAAKVDRLFGFWPLEVYGSTETSGIAWRQSKNGSAWTPFDNAEIRLNKEGCLVVKSPYIKDEAGFTTGDLAELLPDGRFVLKGRADSIVKIEEKRVSLPEVESRVMQSGMAADAAVIALEDKRQYLAAVIVLNELGKKQFGASEKFEVNKFFREHLRQFFEAMVIPRRWRYVDALSRNPQGKLLKQELEKLFDADKTVMLPQGIAGSIIEKTANTAVVEFALSAACPYFDGHFPSFAILPAVAQFELVTFCAENLFTHQRDGAELSIHSVRRIKFSNIIAPDTKLRLLLQYEEKRAPSGGLAAALRFSFQSPDKNKMYASGTILYESAAGKDNAAGTTEAAGQDKAVSATEAGNTAQTFGEKDTL